MNIIMKTVHGEFRVLIPFKLISKCCNFGSISSVRPYTTQDDVLNPKFFKSMKKEKALPKKDGAWLLLTIPIATFALGTWQIKRKLWKDELIKNLEDLMQLKPVDFPEDLDKLKNMEYHSVKLKGKFDHSKEIFMGPRSLVMNNQPSNSSSVLSRPTAGYWVITPFTLSNRDLTIMVNRGWVPAKQRSPATRLEGQITSEIEIVGVVRHSESRQPLGMKNIPQKGYWMYRDLEKMAEYTGASPILIDADASSTVPNGPIGGQTLVSLSNNHLNYIFTWYALCAATSYMWYLRYIKAVK